jgi:hypothetical protein
VDSGRELIGSGEVAVGGGKEPGIWQNFGFKRATEGINWLGTKFKMNRMDLSLPMVLSYKITEPDKDPVTAVPLNLFTCPGDNGEVTFYPADDFYKRWKDMKGGGGMTRIDPPTLDLSAGDDAPVDSVVDELQPYQFGGKPAAQRDHNTPDQAARGTEGRRLHFDPVTQRFFMGVCPKWMIYERADRMRALHGQKDEAGDLFMEAFNNAFGEEDFWDDDF